MAAKSMKDAFNQQLGFLDNTVQPQTQHSWDEFNAQNQGTYNNIAGLYSPQSIASANQGFDQGIDTYEQRANDMYNNAGYSPEEIQGQRTATEAGFAAPVADATNQMKLNQQRTGNSAGTNSNIAALARQKGQLISAGLGGLEQGIGQQRIQGQQAALTASQFPQQARLQRMQTEQATAGLGLQSASQNQSAYGTGVSGQLANAGIRSGNINSNPGFMQQLGGAVATGIGKGLTGGLSQLAAGS